MWKSRNIHTCIVSVNLIFSAKITYYYRLKCLIFIEEDHRALQWQQDQSEDHLSAKSLIFMGGKKMCAMRWPKSGDQGQVLPVANRSPQNHPMARPLRIEFADAVYNVASRGDRREAIYRDDEDRQRHLAVIAQAMDQFDAQVLAYCLMGNHYHLVVQTR